MTKHFRSDPAFRVAQSVVNLPLPLIRRVAGPPIVIDEQELDPYLQYMLWLMDRGPLAKLANDPDSSARRRRSINAITARLAFPLAKGVSVEDRVIHGPAQPLAVRIYRADNLAAVPPVLLYLHGGGFVVGDLDTHEALARMLARITRTVVVAAEYRKAPEHPHPAAVLDCVAAYDWAVEHAADIGARPGRVAVMGDSAGGNLAAVVSRVVRDRGTTPTPIAQALLYPVTDLRLKQPSHALFPTGFFLTELQMRWFRAQYAPDPSSWHDPTVSPLLDDRFDGLPPTRIWTAGFDPLRDEGERYGEALAAAGVPTGTVRQQSLIHGHFSMGLVPGGLQRTAQMCRQVGALVWEHAGL